MNTTGLRLIQNHVPKSSFLVLKRPEPNHYFLTEKDLEGNDKFKENVMGLLQGITGMLLVMFSAQTFIPIFHKMHLHPILDMLSILSSVSVIPALIAYLAHKIAKPIEQKFIPYINLKRENKNLFESDLALYEKYMFGLKNFLEENWFNEDLIKYSFGYHDFVKGFFIFNGFDIRENNLVSMKSFDFIATKANTTHVIKYFQGVKEISLLKVQELHQQAVSQNVEKIIIISHTKPASETLAYILKNNLRFMLTSDMAKEVKRVNNSMKSIYL